MFDDVLIILGTTNHYRRGINIWTTVVICGYCCVWSHQCSPLSFDCPSYPVSSILYSKGTRQCTWITVHTYYGHVCRIMQFDSSIRACVSHLDISARGTGFLLSVSFLPLASRMREWDGNLSTWTHSQLILGHFPTFNYIPCCARHGDHCHKECYWCRKWRYQRYRTANTV